jgi:hypothetical protein
MQAIHYKGGAPAIADVVGGQVPVGIVAITPALPHLRSGRLRPIALTTTRRSALAPELPTLEESGFAGFDIAIWVGMFAPAGTPAKVVAKLSADARSSRRRVPTSARSRSTASGSSCAPRPRSTRKSSATRRSSRNEASLRLHHHVAPQRVRDEALFVRAMVERGMLAGRRPLLAAEVDPRAVDAPARRRLVAIRASPLPMQGERAPSGAGTAVGAPCLAPDRHANRGQLLERGNAVALRQAGIELPITAVSLMDLSPHAIVDVPTALIRSSR